MDRPCQVRSIVSGEFRVEIQTFLRKVCLVVFNAPAEALLEVGNHFSAKEVLLFRRGLSMRTSRGEKGSKDHENNAPSAAVRRERHKTWMILGIGDGRKKYCVRVKKVQVIVH